MTGSRDRSPSLTAAAWGGTPRAVAAWGVLGLVPFLALPAALVFRPAWGPLAALAVALYAGLILAFLGGARFGLCIPATRPDGPTLAGSMLPPLAAWGLLLWLHDAPKRLLIAIGLALALSWAWDALTVTAPAWYRPLRGALSAAAVGSLALAAALLG